MVEAGIDLSRRPPHPPGQQQHSLESTVGDTGVMNMHAPNDRVAFSVRNNQVNFVSCGRETQAFFQENSDIVTGMCGCDMCYLDHHRTLCSKQICRSNPIDHLKPSTSKLPARILSGCGK